MKTLGMHNRLGTTVLNMNVSFSLMIGVHPMQFRLIARTPFEDDIVEMLPSVRGPCALEGEILPGLDGSPREARSRLVSEGAKIGSLVDTTI